MEILFLIFCMQYLKSCKQLFIKKNDCFRFLPIQHKAILDAIILGHIYHAGVVVYLI